MRVGLTGGLACGKSFVGETLVQLGCHLIQADVLGHEALALGGAAYEAVVATFGSSILSENGEIDRRRLAGEVFGKPDRLGLLNSLVHPAVFAREEELAREFERKDPCAIVVLEAAILIETGSYKRFRKLILVTCNAEQQMERAMRRHGSTREDVLARLERQMPLEEKRKYADYVIDTSGTKQDTLRQTKVVFEDLRRLVL